MGWTLTPSKPDGQSWRGYNILVVSPTPTHPQDHGNRKRIYEICATLKDRGANIHFVHYPAEHDWRHAKPLRHEEEMKACWHSYQLVPPTRPLHSDAIGLDHGIDEWADPAIGHYVSWICSMQPFDAVIVNYTWLSFALESVPADVFKICDTHDAFGHRRALLAANGVRPEFFHTTPEEEAVGLARADLVWAIKDAERIYFETELGLKNCLTMLHADPERGWWQGAPSQDGWLRAGVIGARNNVNRLNLETFLAQALPMIEAYMAPVKIVIAGGCSDDFRHLQHPNIELLGRVPEVADFYRDVDVVIAPMQFSTGLKIKVSEALAAGAPLIAHAHATEGFPTAEPLHRLPSFKAMALELIKLSFGREHLPRLAESSRLACYEIRRGVEQTLEATRQQLLAKQAEMICVIVPMAALDDTTLLHDHLIAATDYLRFVSKIALFVTGEPVKIGRGFQQHIGDQIRIYADPVLLARLGESAPDSWLSIGLQDLFETRGFRRAYIMADCEEQLLFGTGNLQRAFVRHDAVELAGGNADELIDLLRANLSVVVLGSDTRRTMRWKSVKGVEEVVQLPYRRTGPFLSLSQRPASPVHRNGVVIFCALEDPVAQEVAQELARLAAALGRTATLFDLSDPATAQSYCMPAVEQELPDCLTVLREAVLVIDIAPPSSWTSALGEAVERRGVPVLTLLQAPGAASLQGVESLLMPRSLGALLRTVAAALVDANYMRSLREATKHNLEGKINADAGWTWLWHNAARLDAAEDSEGSNASELLFGL